MQNTIPAASPIQIDLDFTTPSPINVDKLTGQNRRLYDFLMTGQKIHVFHPAKRMLKIGFLNSRISDLINKFGVNIEKRMIKVNDIDGNPVDVKEYFISL